MKKVPQGWLDATCSHRQTRITKGTRTSASRSTRRGDFGSTTVNSPTARFGRRKGDLGKWCATSSASRRITAVCSSSGRGSTRSKANASARRWRTSAESDSTIYSKQNCDSSSSTSRRRHGAVRRCICTSSPTSITTFWRDFHHCRHSSSWHKERTSNFTSGKQGWESQYSLSY